LLKADIHLQEARQEKEEERKGRERQGARGGRIQEEHVSTHAYSHCKDYYQFDLSYLNLV
jgi:hypothetical protein